MTWQDELFREFDLDDDRIKSLDQLLQMVRVLSDRNLTAVTTTEGIVDIHFRDSLSLISFAEVTRAATAVDVGSGAGFPGLPLAIALPDLKLTLLEANRKKCDFIGKAISALGLDNAHVLSARAEDAGRGDLRDFFDIAFARAVGPLALTLEYVLPLIRPGGHALLQRGSILEGEEELAASVATQLSAVLDQVLPVQPYPDAENLHVWLLRKTGPTPDRFPRKPGLARKRPLS